MGRTTVVNRTNAGSPQLAWQRCGKDVGYLINEYGVASAEPHTNAVLFTNAAGLGDMPTDSVAANFAEGSANACRYVIQPPASNYLATLVALGRDTGQSATNRKGLLTIVEVKPSPFTGRKTRPKSHVRRVVGKLLYDLGASPIALTPEQVIDLIPADKRSAFDWYWPATVTVVLAGVQGGFDAAGGIPPEVRWDSNGASAYELWPACLDVYSASAVRSADAMAVFWQPVG